MGFERVTGIIQNTKNFTDFSRVISNYETDIFRPIFDKLEELSGKKYGSTLPPSGSEISNLESQIQTDIAFRVIADHIRTLSFAIADGFREDVSVLLAREGRRGIDKAGFDVHMDQPTNRARAAQKREVISLSQIGTSTPTTFIGFDKLEMTAKVLDVVGAKEKTAVIL